MIKSLLPPFLYKYLTTFIYGWSGNYSSWEAAEKKCTGYDSDIIFNKVKAALLKVKNGEAVAERDSVLFDKIPYSFPLLSSLSLVALAEKRLNVLDFGGSLGSSYYHNKIISEHVTDFQWNIVEQKHFIEEGKKTFANQELNFYYTIDECLQEQQANVVLLGSVIQYIKEPYDLLKEILSHKIPYLIIDRTPVFKTNNDRITIQKVPKNIYEAKYPCWILNETKLINYICSLGYEMIFDAEYNENIYLSNAYYKGYYFKLKQ